MFFFLINKAKQQTFTYNQSSQSTRSTIMKFRKKCDAVTSNQLRPCSNPKFQRKERQQYVVMRVLAPSCRMLTVPVYYILTRYYVFHAVFRYFSLFHLCYAALHVRVCEPHGDGISSRRHLLDNPVLRTRYARSLQLLQQFNR